MERCRAKGYRSDIPPCLCEMREGDKPRSWGMYCEWAKHHGEEARKQRVEYLNTIAGGGQLLVTNPAAAATRTALISRLINTGRSPTTGGERTEESPARRVCSRWGSTVNLLRGKPDTLEFFATCWACCVSWAVFLGALALAHFGRAVETVAIVEIGVCAICVVSGAAAGFFTWNVLWEVPDVVKEWFK